MTKSRYNSFNGKSFSMKSVSIMVSARLLGARCRYDDGHSLFSGLFPAVDSAHVIPVCPEQLGGLPTPRSPADISDGDGSDVLTGRGRVIDATGVGVSRAFLPHCQNAEGRGSGVTAALFQREGIRLLEQGRDSAFSLDNFLDLLRSISTEEKTDVWTRTR